MKNSIEKFLSALPYFILLALTGVILVVWYRTSLNFENFLSLLQALIWPTIVLMALLFFRKVLTYLFFSMEEFNFFGTKGGLKNVKQMIEEKAQEMYETEIREEENKQKEAELNKKIEVLKKEKQTNNTEWTKLAKDILSQLKGTNDENEKLKKEVSELKLEKTRAITAATYRAKALRRQLEDGMPTDEEIEAAGDQYIQQYIDQKRGK